LVEESLNVTTCKEDGVPGGQTASLLENKFQNRIKYIVS